MLEYPRQAALLGLLLSITVAFVLGAVFTGLVGFTDEPESAEQSAKAAETPMAQAQMNQG